MDDLRVKVGSPQYAGRRKIGAFSAASNVSGVTTPVYEVARILHENDALAFFDFAAAAPYVEMDMRRDDASSFDALYFSPHKFLGGPGSCGVLIFDEGIYRADLPPTVGAGGTVDFVGFEGQSYSTDIETREKPGTPGILQTLRAALAMELKEMLGPARIARPRGGADAPRFRRAVRASRHRADGRRRPRKPAAHLLLQRSGRLLVASSPVRHHAPQRPLRDPEPRRLLLRRPVRAPHPAYRRAEVPGPAPFHHVRERGLETGVGPRELPLPPHRHRGAVHLPVHPVRGRSREEVPAAVRVRHPLRRVAAPGVSSRPGFPSGSRGL